MCQLKTIYCGLQELYIHLGYYSDVQLIDIKITQFLTEQYVDFISFSWCVNSMANLYTALIVSTEVQFQTKAS